MTGFTRFFLSLLFWEPTPFWPQSLSLYSPPTKRGKHPLAASKNGSINPKMGQQLEGLCSQDSYVSNYVCMTQNGRKNKGYKVRTLIKMKKMLFELPLRLTSIKMYPLLSPSLFLSLCLLFLLFLLQAAGERGRWLHLPTLKRSKIHAPKEKNKKKNINIKIENLLLLYLLVKGIR